jgi:hypothetical protein
VNHIDTIIYFTKVVMIFKVYNLVIKEIPMASN